MAESILNSWKDIAAHLHTSVRTAQRWEAQLHLPVHRPGSNRKGPILAFTGELDEWLKNGKSRVRRLPNDNGAGAKTAERYQDTRHNLDELLELAKRITANTVLMQQQMQRALELRKTVEKQRGTRAARVEPVIIRESVPNGGQKYQPAGAKLALIR